MTRGEMEEKHLQEFLKYCSQPHKEMTRLEQVALGFAMSIVQDGPVDTDDDGYSSHIESAFKAAARFCMKSWQTASVDKIRKLVAE